MTVADMNRLERAAGLSMGGFTDADAPADTLPRAGNLRVAALSVAGIALLAFIAFVAVI